MDTIKRKPIDLMQLVREMKAQLVDVLKKHRETEATLHAKAGKARDDWYGRKISQAQYDDFVENRWQPEMAAAIRARERAEREFIETKLLPAYDAAAHHNAALVLALVEQAIAIDDDMFEAERALSLPPSQQISLRAFAARHDSRGLRELALQLQQIMTRRATPPPLREPAAPDPARYEPSLT
jgi:hypothetical protein